MPPGPKPQFTPEELKERNRTAAREYQRRKRTAQPPKIQEKEDPEDIKARRAAHQREYMRKRRAAMSEEEKATERAKKQAADTAHRQENREAYNAKQAERRANDRERYRETNRRWYAAHREQAYLAGLDSGKRYRVKVRLEAFRAYGGENFCCKCCGESTLEFLALDHIDGGGNAHRKSIRPTGIVSMYEWAKRSGYPPIFQVLCHNCNLAKGFYGSCPHAGYMG